MSADGKHASAVGRVLAEALGWRRAEARDPALLHVTVDAVLGRREHLLVTTPPLMPSAQAMVRGELHCVRFVDLDNLRGSLDEISHAIRNDFGL